ncbi:MAG: DUF6603 domain-containing protein [Actinomycetota bacterium]
MNGIERWLLDLLAEVVDEVQRTFTDPDRRSVAFGRLGWDVPDVPSEYTDLAADARDVIAAIGELTDGATLDEIVTLIVEAAELIEGIATLPAPPAIPAPDVSAFEADLAGPFVEELIIDALGRVAPGGLGLAAAVGAVTPVDETAGPRPRLRYAFDPSRLRDLVTRPVPVLRDDIAEWATSDDAARQIVDTIGALLANFDLPIISIRTTPELRRDLGVYGPDAADDHLELQLVDGEVGGVEVLLGLQLIAVDTSPPRFLVKPVVEGALNASAEIIENWTFDLTATVDAADRTWLDVSPDGVAVYAEDGTAGGTDFSVAASLTHRPSSPIRFVGSAEGTRIEGAALTASIGLHSASTEIVGSFAVPELKLILAAGDSDTFMASILGNNETAIDLPLDIAYSNTDGLSMPAEFGVAFDIYPERTIGPITIERFGIFGGVDGSDPESLLLIRADVDLSGQVEVFAARIEGIGLELSIGIASGDHTPSVAIGFVPPAMVGFSIDAEAIKGGGFLAIDADIGRYSGALAIEVISVGISAIVVVDTQLPGDEDGFALFAALFLEFPGIPLGFGFSLTGVGGIVALNRTLDSEALALGLRSGVIDSLLFPDDPVNDAAQIISSIDSYFPILPGNTVFGPVIEISWGTPIIITAEIGVVISLPEGIIAVLGSISANLPEPNAPILELNLDVLGVIDIPRQEMSIVASLYDSTLIGVISLSGDMAMYLSTGSQPYFLMSVGGYHPSFRPPSNVPAAMQDLRRMTASIAIGSTVDISIRAYFAITSNTVQFGASVNVEASTKVVFTTYTARGWFEFNVLLQFTPFKFVADMSAGVAVYSGNKELMGVHLDVLVEGPEPWYAKGTASFKFFGVKVNFNVEVGSKASGGSRETLPIRDEVVAELEQGSSWTEAAPEGGVTAGVIFVELDEADADLTWIRPDHQLSVTQKTAPLNRTIEVLGESLPAPGHERLEITAAGIGDTEADGWTVLDDWFAPAQFEQIGRNEKLTRESFELMNAGVTFGSPVTVVTADTDANCHTITVDYETEVFTDAEEAMATFARLGAIGEAVAIETGAIQALVSMDAPEYMVVNALDGTRSTVVDEAVTGLSQHDALQLIDFAVAGGAMADSLMIVPTAATLTEIGTP